MSNKDHFSSFIDFRESLTLAMLQSGLSTLYGQMEFLPYESDLL
jgi:hypothetical protein